MQFNYFSSSFYEIRFPTKVESPSTTDEISATSSSELKEDNCEKRHFDSHPTQESDEPQKKTQFIFQGRK